MEKGKYKILLVDDEPDILEFVGYNLRKEGFRVYTAANGLDAINRALEVKPHLILMDVMMPRWMALKRKVIRRIRVLKCWLAFLTAGERITPRYPA